MGTLSPPHDINLTVRSEGAANWFTNLLSSSIKIPVKLEILGLFQGIVAFIFGVLFLIMISLSFYNKKIPVLAVFLAICFIISTYLGLMTSVALE